MLTQGFLHASADENEATKAKTQGSNSATGGHDEFCDICLKVGSGMFKERGRSGEREEVVDEVVGAWVTARDFDV